MTQIYPFERIVVEVVDDIRSGRLNPGDQIPTIEEWKQRYGVGYHTIRKARLLLKRRLFIERDGNFLHVTSLAPYL